MPPRCRYISDLECSMVSAQNDQTHCFYNPTPLEFGPGFAGTPPRARKEIVHTVWQCKAGTVSEIHLGKACKKTIIAHFFEGWYFCKRLADHVLQKRHCAVVHSLMNRFGRHRQMRA